MNNDTAENATTASVFSVVKEDSKITSQTALCSLAMFSASLSDQSKIVKSLENMQKVLRSKHISILRVKQGEAKLQKLVQVGTHTHTNATADAVMAFIQEARLGVGTTQVIQNDIATTVVLVALQAKGGVCDIAQFTFQKTDASNSINVLNTMAPALAVAWNNRRAGLATALAFGQSRTRRTTVEQDFSAPILGVENAYGLSRSEFRVCILLAAGLRPKTIANELGLSIATVRTHLRNIYAKTDMPGQVEVISHIGRSSSSFMQAA